MLFLISSFLILIFVFVNTLFYSMSLLVIVISLLYVLVSNLMLHSLTILLIIIVYVGAMMILIGYICAICPNLILIPKSVRLRIFICYFFLVTLLFISEYTSSVVDIFLPITNYFYSFYGGISFFVIILMLFITLLMVTSQYITPKGPFRSVSI